MSAFIAAVKGVIELLAVLKEVIELYQEAKRDGWLEEGRELAKTIRGAKSDEERRDLVRKLSQHLRN